MQGIIHTNSFDEQLLRKTINWFRQTLVTAESVIGPELAVQLKKTRINLSPVIAFKNGPALSPCLTVDYFCDELIRVNVLVQAHTDVFFATRFFNTLNQNKHFPELCFLVSPSHDSIDLLEYSNVLHINLSGFDNKSSGSKPRKSSG